MCWSVVVSMEAVDSSLTSNRPLRSTARAMHSRCSWLSDSYASGSSERSQPQRRHCLANLCSHAGSRYLRSDGHCHALGREESCQKRRDLELATNASHTCDTDAGPCRYLTLQERLLQPSAIARKRRGRSLKLKGQFEATEKRLCKGCLGLSTAASAFDILPLT